MSHFTKVINQNGAGLYRDNGLIVVKNLNGQQDNGLRKNIAQVFKKAIKTNFYTKKATTTTTRAKKITGKIAPAKDKGNIR